MDWTVLQQVVGIVAGVASTIAILTWWLSGQFNHSRDIIFTKIDAVFDKLMDKLEYHEQHDDKRFEAINRDLWELRLQNAVNQGRRPRARQEETPREESN